MLDVSDAGLCDLIALGGGRISPTALVGLLKREDEPGFVRCDGATLDQFLNGLIIERRGPPPQGQPQAREKHVTNNTVLKKLRVAFELKEDDLAQMLEAEGFEVSRPELSALFRKPDHRNFRPCGDQFLRNFLKALTGRVRGSTAKPATSRSDAHSRGLAASAQHEPRTVGALPPRPPRRR